MTTIREIFEAAKGEPITQKIGGLEFRFESRANGAAAVYRVVTHESGSTDSHIIGRFANIDEAVAAAKDAMGYTL